MEEEEFDAVDDALDGRGVGGLVEMGRGGEEVEKEKAEDEEVLEQRAQLLLKETVSLMSHLSKGGPGFGQMNEGKMLVEDAGRKGARDTIQQVENQIAANEKKNAERAE